MEKVVANTVNSTYCTLSPTELLSLFLFLFYLSQFLFFFSLSKTELLGDRVVASYPRTKTLYEWTSSRRFDTYLKDTTGIIFMEDKLLLV